MTKSKNVQKKVPTTWPKYEGLLGKELALHDSFADEIPKRLALICQLYSIDQRDMFWERQLMMALLLRHVPGFQVQLPAATSYDILLFIDRVDWIKGQHFKKTGKKLNDKIAVYEAANTMVDDEDPESVNPFAGKNPSTLLRIYTGAKEHIEHLNKKLHDSMSKWKLARENGANCRKLDQHQHAAILHKRYRARIDQPK